MAELVVVACIPGVVCLDQLTKSLRLPRRVTNPRWRAGKLSRSWLVAAWTSVAAAAVASGALEGRPLVSFGVALALGGAGANVVDRLVRGRVVDFVLVRFWPAFNLADSAIVVGVPLAAIGVAI